jgi:hypothetical protein
LIAISTLAKPRPLSIILGNGGVSDYLIEIVSGELDIASEENHETVRNRKAVSPHTYNMTF